MGLCGRWKNYRDRDYTSIQYTENKNELLPVGHDSMTGLVVYIIETMN